MQRMMFFLFVCTIPIGAIWLNAEHIIGALVPERETARLAGLYLKVVLIGTPGYAAFESGKRFVQAQGLFSATLYCLLFCAPLNVFLHWLFVWHLKWGFVGAPISVAITETLLPVCLFLYVRFVDGMQCWGGFSKAAFRNWGPMIKLALPGLVMVEAEYAAFEILTFASAFFGSTALAAQSVLATVSVLTYQLPFPLSIAASTRVANLIGATLADAAKTASQVAFCGAAILGTLNIIIIAAPRHFIPTLFTNDQEVIELVANTLPVVAAFQLLDALAAMCNGILRGIGRQDIGGYVGLFSYYIIGLPVSFALGFGLKWGLIGLWTGPALALGVVTALEAWFIYKTSWQNAVEAAQSRNSAA